MSPVRRWLFPLAAALAVAAPVSAQWKPTPDAATQQTPSTTPPSLELGLASRVHAVEAATATFVAPPLPGVERTSQDVALMIVGGAALILGSVIGDDAGAMMMVGGGIVGLVGLYQYLT